MRSITDSRILTREFPTMQHCLPLGQGCKDPGPREAGAELCLHPCHQEYHQGSRHGARAVLDPNVNTGWTRRLPCRPL